MANKYSNDFSLALRAWRDRRDLSQPQAASALGVSVDVYRSWEQAQRRPASYVEAIMRQKMAQAISVQQTQ